MPEFLQITKESSGKLTNSWLDLFHWKGRNPNSTFVKAATMQMNLIKSELNRRGDASDRAGTPSTG